MRVHWQVAILHRTSRIVSSGLAIDDMLQELVAITVEVTGCDACLVYLPDRETGDIVLRASQLPHDAEIGEVRLNLGEGSPDGLHSTNLPWLFPTTLSRIPASSTLQL